jgi:hypothetical protein
MIVLQLQKRFYICLLKYKKDTKMKRIIGLLIFILTVLSFLTVSSYAQ